ncbi:hypothetical protein AAVH_00444 [Aphelenchoides avenae]|nr:hypothetical protein AAVH_00444 [Aphelenchus avenae]
MVTPEAVSSLVDCRHEGEAYTGLEIALTVYCFLLCAALLIITGMTLWIQRMHSVAKLHLRTMPSRRMVAWMTQHRRSVFERRRKLPEQ